MTREEAIEIIEKNLEVSRWRYSELFSEALEMAIKALEQEPCEDCISRTQAIKAMDELENEDIEAYGCKIPEGFDGERARLSICLLPSIQPKPKTEWVPVSERLPEDKQSVLVWCSQYKNIYCAYLEKKQWWIFGAFIQIVPNEVVAWMPLPKPYEPQESEDKE